MHSETPSSTSVRNQLLRWGVVMAVIYAIYLWIFPLLPSIDRSKTVLDIEMLLRNGKESYAAVYIVGLGVLFYAYWRVLKIVHAFSKEQPDAAKSLRVWVLGIGVVCALPLLGLYPITALDVVLYVVRARIWALYGGSPMLALPTDYPQDPFIRLAGEYVKQPSPYGPLWELIAQIPMQLGITGIGSGIIAMKIISLIAYIATGVLIGWYALQASPRYGASNLTALTFFALNPLVLMQVIGNGHNDILLLAFMTLGLILWQRDKWIWATVAFTLATLVKVTGLIFLPLFGVAVLVQAPDWKRRVTRGLGMVLIFGVISLIAFRLTGPLPDVFEGTRIAMFNRLGYTPSYMVRIFLIHFYARSYAVTKLPTDLGNYLFILYYLYLLIRLALRKLTLIEAGFLAFFAQLFLGSTFRIWYPLWLIPFAALNLNSATYWRTFLFSITAEFSILAYYILWRWGLHHWSWGEQTFKKYWDYWLIMTWFTVPWTFGIPYLVPFFRRRRNQEAFDNTLWID